MKVLVCGSRDGWRRGDYRELLKRIAELPEGTTVIHGDARGPDRVAGALAEAFGMKVTAVSADWLKHGRAAGPIRNTAMLDMKPDLVIAFWNGHSRGTKNTIDQAEARGIPVEIVP
jgi:ABC-type Fe3+-hydroxamate transport system substrate-binding protein